MARNQSFPRFGKAIDPIMTKKKQAFK
ncbi:uncharacterized protein G2W53_000583 [Senna tora]|uniref:Uncharacterized protein n=1 Tax=Senna tora TaxID=362788 RepID=A0A834XFM2_9FABA|nr:uncharacterized protein G2W53_000583 [Senna tora]